MKNKIAIVCNSTNPDLVEYFICKIDSLKKSKYKTDFLIFKNTSITIDESSNIYNSSYVKKAFFDKKVPIEFIVSFYMLYTVLVNRVKVVHFTTAHISNIFLSILLKPFNIKQIFTIHDLVPHPGKKSMLINLYNKFVINFLSDEIISFSKKEINKQNKKEKFKHFTLSGFTQYYTKPKVGQKTVLFFGRIEQYKGLNNLLDLIIKVNNSNLDYKFIIAGKGHIKNITKFEELDNVEIINKFIDDNEVNQLFERATFTILPYDSATQSGVTILSYAHATPVIAYDVGSLGEYVKNGENGFLVKYKNNDDILKILKTLNDEDILKLSKNCIDVFNEKYSSSSCHKMYYCYYKQILDSKWSK